ncbi:hypothetical protein KFK09_002975 [Dendrobium nobile]|uniref:Bromo domain-containing protein n=1 Tax=Dendrobium nobile TaxID=94219 RepID=A0A8T3C6E0_DENNO|nr:hypothetical protein KFK09_002975 [Dendrobium nobile]
MMAKPAATKIRLGNKHNGRPPRPDPPLLRHLPPPPPPETRRRRSLRPRRRRQLSEGTAYEFDHEEEEEEEERGLKKLRLVVKLPRSPAGRLGRAAAVSTASSSSSSSPSPSPASSSSSSYADEDELGVNGDDEVEPVKPPKKRRIDRCGDAAAVAVCRSGYHEESKKNAFRRSSGDGSGYFPSSWNGTPMPEKKVLELILLKLQRKDTYNAFAEPVDPEELPDYHDVIEHPMDFGTVRKKLGRGAYRSFEQFEDDVLLICSNAMQYNAPDTVYFRQACAIQDLARKKFQRVRENVKHKETEQTEHRSKEKASLTPMEKKITRTLRSDKIQHKAVVEPIVSDISSGATLASAGDTSTGLSTVNGVEKFVAVNELLDASSSLEGSKQEKCGAGNGLLDASSSLEESKQEKSVAVNGLLDASSSLRVSEQEKPVAVHGLVDASSALRESKQEKAATVNELIDASSSLGESKQDKGDDFSAKCSPSKLGRKPAPIDENRRATYSTSLQQKSMVESDFVLDLFDDEQKQLVPVGLDSEHSYARSLARFTASLGPVAWEIVSKKIEKALPPGIKFGPGWVGEYEPLPTPFLSVGNCNQQLTNKSRTATNDKVAEMKSKNGQTPNSDNIELLVKERLTSKAPRKTSNSGKIISCENSGEQKPRFLGVDGTAKSKINGTVGLRQCSDSSNINIGVNSQMMNNRSLSIASIRVKEETPCDDIAERKQEVIHANDQMNPHQLKNQTTADFPKAFTNALPQALSGPSGNPSNKAAQHTSFPGSFSRENSHMQTETQKIFQAVSSKNLNNAPEIGIRGSNNCLAFISSNQTGVNYGVGRANNHDQVSNYPFKLASFPGKVSNQQNFATSGTSHVEQSTTIVPPLTKENFSPATSAAAKAWMSVGTSGQWKSVDSKNTSEKPSISSPFCNSPTWKPPVSASQFNGYSIVRPANLPLQVEASQVKNRGLVIFPQLIPTDLSKYQNHPWQLSSPQTQSKQRDNLPPDLNIGYQAPTSPIQPSSSLAMDSQHPDLALQL